MIDEGRATILIVEDDEATCRFLGDNLSADGHEVLIADTARDGLRLLEHEVPRPGGRRSRRCPTATAST